MAILMPNDPLVINYLHILQPKTTLEVFTGQGSRYGVVHPQDAFQSDILIFLFFPLQQ
ncbi:MAG TPA: hypothetical protein V6D10_01175 [Trichocoleus sp.]|jgi:hypothetical protein